MPVRVVAAPSVLTWALEVSSTEPEKVRSKFAVEKWIEGAAQPTLKQLQSFATITGVPFGYLLLAEPPQWTLPVPDFREGFANFPTPSADLIAVLNLAERRQAWYREYALAQGATALAFVGSAADANPVEAAAEIRATLGIEVVDRSGNWSDARKLLLRNFESVGGLTVATSMVGNNTHRWLNEDEFRGFSLVDDIAPLIFVNTHQTLNGQIFTIAHELAHVWRGASGIGNEDPRSGGQSNIERWCNAVASEVLVPSEELRARYGPLANLGTTEVLDRLAADFRCGTLVVLQALNRARLRRFEDFDAAYDGEVRRLAQLSEERQSSGGGNHYNSQPFRVGERLSRALVADTLEGRTTFTEAMDLMSMKSLSTFDEYVRRLGAA